MNEKNLTHKFVQSMRQNQFHLIYLISVKDMQIGLIPHLRKKLEFLKS